MLKAKVIRYSWPEFCEKFFLNDEPRRDAQSALNELEEVCSEYLAKHDWELLSFQLGRIRDSHFREGWGFDFDPILAEYLGREPWWTIGRFEVKEQEWKPKFLPPRPEESREYERYQVDWSEEFTRFYIQSEQADAVGDGRASVQAAAQAYELVRRNRKSFGKDVAPQLGNLGVNAEKYNALDLAEQIWRLALEIDPEHSSIMQQFASYIIDNRPDLYSEAEEILKRLQTGRHAEHKPGRTLSFLVQLKAALGQEVDEALTAQMAEAAETETDVKQLGAILDGLIDAGGQFQLGVQLFASTVERFPRKSRYTLQRMVADALARRSEIECEFIAMDLYRQILANPEIIDAGDEPSVMANYATLLYKHDYDDEAGCLWFKAYQSTGGGHSGIRRAYSMYLLRAGHGDMAQKVIGGEPIDEMVLIPTEKELPKRFSDIELPDALSESGKSPFFRCVEQSDSGI